LLRSEAISILLNLPRIVAKQEEGEQMMRQLKMTMCLFVSILALIFLGQAQSMAAGQMDTSQLTYNIGTQSLKSALEMYQETSGLNLAYSDDLVQGKMTDGVYGKNTTAQALKKILKDTGLTYTVTNQGTVVLRKNKMVVSQREVEKREKVKKKEEVKRPVEMEQMTVTATKAPIKVQEVPAAVSIVTWEDIKLKAGVDTFYDALRDLPGFFLPKGMVAPWTGITLRGERPAVLINGRDVRPFHGGPDFPGYLMNMGAVERIEVVKGPQSGVHGSKSLTGVINVITKKGDRENPYLEINSFYGTGDQLHGGFSLSGGYEKLSYYINASAEQQEKYKTPVGTIPFTEYDSKNLYSRFDYAFSDYHNITLEYVNSETDCLCGADEGLHSLQTWRYLYNDTPQKTTYGTLSYNGDLTDWFSLSASFSVGELDLGSIEASEDNPFALFTKEGNVHKYLEDFYWGEIKGTFNILPEERLRAIAGVQYKNSEMDWKVWNNYVLTSSIKEEETFYAPYLQVEYRPIDYALLTGGVRYDKYTYDEGSDKDATSPKIGLSIFPFANTDYDWTTLWASYSEAFRTPYGYQLYAPHVGNPDLKPEEAEGWEVGLKQRIDLWANLEFSYFESDYTDKIQFNPDIVKFDNIGKAKLEGYEFLLEVYPYSFLSLYFAYTDQEVTDEISGKEILGSPGQIFKYGLRVEDLYGIYFSVDGRHRSDWKYNEENDQPSEDKMLWDAKLLYRWNIRGDILFEPFISVENITDKEYYASELRIMQGRTWHVGASLKVNF
jgi:vitamin B12 transporter